MAQDSCQASLKGLICVYLDEWPVGRRVQQLDHHRQAVVEAHCILGHLGVLVAGGQVTQSADGRLGDVFPVTGSQDGADQGLDAPHLAEETGEAVCEERLSKRRRPSVKRGSPRGGDTLRRGSPRGEALHISGW